MNIQTIRNQIEYLRQAGEDVSDLIAFAEKWRYVMSKLPNAVETRKGSKYPYKVPAGTKIPKEKAATPAKKKDSPKPKPSSPKKPKAEMIADALKVALEHIKEYHPDATHDDFMEALWRMSGKGGKPNKENTDTEKKPISDHELGKNIVSEFKNLQRESYSNSKLVPIHEIRDKISKKYGNDAASHKRFDDMLFSLWKEKKIHMVPITLLSEATQDQLNKSVPGTGETFFYLDSGENETSNQEPSQSEQQESAPAKKSDSESPKQKNPANTVDINKAVIDKIKDLQDGEFGPVTTWDLRDAMPKGLQGKEFDKAILKMAEDGKLIIQRHDEPDLLPKNRQNKMVSDGESKFLYVSLRDTSGDSPKPEPVKSANVADQFKAAYAKLNDGETLDKIGYDGLTKAVNDLFDEVGVDATNFKFIKGEASGIYKTPSSVGVLKKRIVDNLKERLGRFHRAQNIQKEFEGGKNASKANPEPESNVAESEEPEKMEEPEEVKYKTEELSNTAKHALKQLMRGKILKQDTSANRFNEFGIFEPNGEPISRVPNEDGQMLSQHEDLVEVKPGEFRFQPNHSKPASKPDASSMAFKIAYSPHSDKMSRKLDNVYGDIVKSAHPDMKPDDFKSIMEKAQREGALELHKINEVRILSDQAKQVMPTTDDGHGGKDYFGYAVVKDRAKLEQVINDHLSKLDKKPDAMIPQDEIDRHVSEYNKLYKNETNPGTSLGGFSFPEEKVAKKINELKKVDLPSLIKIAEGAGLTNILGGSKLENLAESTKKAKKASIIKRLDDRLRATYKSMYSNQQ